MSIQFEEYMAQAERCRRLAETMQDTRLKQQYYRLSRCFLACARNLERQKRPGLRWGHFQETWSLPRQVAQF